jgi:ubiquinone/menaquinone biosynthesis C-methylase UbiE
MDITITENDLKISQDRKDEYFILKNIFRNDYKNVSSNKQICTLYNLSKLREGSDIIYRLINILCKYYVLFDYKKNVNNLFKKNLTDFEIFTEIKKFLKKENSGGSKQYRSGYKWSSIIFENMLKARITQNKVNNYLDIGCGSGKMTINLARRFKLNSNNIYGVDKSSFYEKKDWNRKLLKHKFNFKIIGKKNKLPYKNNYFDLISTFNVLHHVEDLDSMLKEINRVLKHNKYFVIREHDNITYVDKMLTDIEHSMYFFLNNKNVDKKIYDNYINNFYSKYYDRYEWDEIMKKYGFFKIHDNHVTKSVHQVVNDTRSNLRIYVKN